MDIYHRTQKAISNVPLGKNKGIYISNLSMSASPAPATFQLFTYGVTGGLTLSSTFIIPEATGFLIPIQVWGISFDSASITAFGVS